jgi:signal transduction histidine kinase
VGPRALREFCQALGFTRGEIWLIAPKRGTLHLFCTYGQDYSAPAWRLSVRECPFTMMLLRRRQGVYHPNVAPDEASRSRWAPWKKVGAVFGSPLRARGRTIGTLMADRLGHPFDMSATDLELASALATLISEVIDSSLERQTKARRHREVMLLNRVGRAIDAEERLRALLPRVARIVREGSECHGVVLKLHDQAAHEMEVVAASGPGARRLLGRRLRSRSGRRVLGMGARVMLSRKPVLIGDVREVPGATPWWPGTRTVLVLPIRRKEQVLGSLRLEAMQPHAFDDGDVRLMWILGEQIGHAIHRARLLEAMARKQANLRAISESLEAMIEQDRRRIARELHDELAQSMTAAKMNLGLLRDLAVNGVPEVGRLLSETAGLLDRTIAETRRISMDLRPAMLDELGLLPALRWYTGDFARRTGIQVALRARGAESRTRREIETLLYRFVQEALTNVARHARARRVQVQLTGVSGRVKAVVADDGVGINMRRGGPPPRGLGLLGMRERIERIGGSLTIDSSRGSGTRLTVSIPVTDTPVARTGLEPRAAADRPRDGGAGTMGGGLKEAQT